jgi:hypothetical protein
VASLQEPEQLPSVVLRGRHGFPAWLEQVPPLHVSAPLQLMPSLHGPATLLSYWQVPATLQPEKPLQTVGGVVQAEPQQTPQFVPVHTVPAELMQNPFVH